MEHPVYWSTLLIEATCLLEHPVYWSTLIIGAPFLLKHPVFWSTLFIGAPCLLKHLVYWSTLFIGAPCLLKHPVFWSTLFIGAPCFLEHPVFWSTLFIGAPCLFCNQSELAQLQSFRDLLRSCYSRINRIVSLYINIYITNMYIVLHTLHHTYLQYKHVNCTSHIVSYIFTIQTCTFYNIHYIIYIYYSNTYIVQCTSNTGLSFICHNILHINIVVIITFAIIHLP